MMSDAGRFKIRGRRADGRGTVTIEACRDVGVALNTARVIFDADQSWTLVWVLDAAEHHVALEVFSRPGFEL